jgi:hypothetical protein
VLAADRDARRLADHLLRVDPVILDELGYLPLPISGRRGVAARAKLSSTGALPADQRVSRAPRAALGDRRACLWLFVGNAESLQLDRLSRNTTDLLVIAREMQRAGRVFVQSPSPSLIPLRISPRTFCGPWRCPEAGTPPHSEAHGTRLADAKAKGVKFGRKPKLTTHRRREAQKRPAAGETQRSIARTFTSVRRRFHGCRQPKSGVRMAKKQLSRKVFEAARPTRNPSSDTASTTSTTANARG